MAEKWEPVTQEEGYEIGNAKTFRLMVPGGWLYRLVWSGETADDLGMSMVYVPLPPKKE